MTRLMHNEHRGIFQSSQSDKSVKVKVSRKPETQLIRKGVRPILVHHHEAVSAEIMKLTKRRNSRNNTEGTENTFMSPAVITVKNDKALKNALDSQKIYVSSIKKRSHKLLMENRSSATSEC